MPREVSCAAAVLAPRDVAVNMYPIEWNFDLNRNQVYACAFKSKHKEVLNLKEAFDLLTGKKRRRIVKPSKAKKTDVPDSSACASSVGGVAKNDDDGEAQTPDEAASDPDSDAEYDAVWDRSRAEVLATVSKVENRLKEFYARQADSKGTSSGASSSSGPIPGFSGDAAGLAKLAARIADEPAILTALANDEEQEKDDLLEEIAGALVAVENSGPDDEAHEMFDAWRAEDKSETLSAIVDHTDRSNAATMEARGLRSEQLVECQYIQSLGPHRPHPEKQLGIAGSDLWLSFLIYS